MSTTITETRPLSQDIELESLTNLQPYPEPSRDINPGVQDIDGYPKGLRLVCITVALILSIFLSALDSTIISTLIPEITNAFGSLNQVGWYGSAYAMTNSAFLSLWGKAYTYFELKRTFVLSVTVFEVGNLLSGFANGSSMLIAGRLVAGIGGAGNLTGCFIIIAYAVKPERRAIFMATLGITFAVASVTGPLLGGAFVDKLSWRWGFWINVPFALVATAMMTLSLKTPRHIAPRTATLREKAVHMDIGGVTILLAAVACFVFSMHYLSTLQGWTNKITIICFVSFLFFSALFIVLEYRLQSTSMIRIDLLRRPRFLRNCIYVFFLAGLYFPLLFSLPIRFQSVDNDSASSSGLRLIPLVCGISVFTMISNYIVSRHSRHTTLLISGGIFGIIGASLISSTSKQATTTMWITFELVVAAGIGIALQLPLIANQASVAADDIPTATSTTLFFETIGQALFVAAGEAAFVNRLIRNLRNSGDHHIDVDLVIKAGATGFRKVLPAEQIPFILDSYLDALRVTYLMSLGCAVAAAVASLWMVVPMVRERMGRDVGARDR